MNKYEVSGHSGLRPEIEIKQMMEKEAMLKAKHDERMQAVCKILDTMPPEVCKRFLLEVCRKYIKK